MAMLITYNVNPSSGWGGMPVDAKYLLTQAVAGNKASVNQQNQAT